MACKIKLKTVKSQGLDDPDTLHEYKILGEIGEGGFSDVYKIEHRVTGHQYALKKIVISRLEDLGIIHCLARERRAARELTDSQWVVKIYTTFVNGPILNMIMELLPNGDICRHIGRTGGFCLEATTFYAAELLLALEYLRSKSWVHRDLKCENLVLDRNWHLKLADFGLAKKIGDPPGRPEENKPSTNIGTPTYKAPEVYKQIPTTCSTDLWGLGCCIYAMYTAREPFGTAYLSNAFKRNVMRGQYRQLPLTADADLRNILRNLLVADPDQRLGAHDLEELKDHPMFTTIPWLTIQQREPPSMTSFAITSQPRPAYVITPSVPPPPPPSFSLQPTPSLPQQGLSDSDFISDTLPMIRPIRRVKTQADAFCGVLDGMRNIVCSKKDD